jgi:hypothetical protein
MTAMGTPATKSLSNSLAFARATVNPCLQTAFWRLRNVGPPASRGLITLPKWEGDHFHHVAAGLSSAPVQQTAIQSP